MVGVEEGLGIKEEGMMEAMVAEEMIGQERARASICPRLI